MDPNHRVFFNFSDMDIEYHSNCAIDYVAVSDWFSNISFVIQEQLYFVADLLELQDPILFILLDIIICFSVVYKCTRLHVG